MSHKPLNSGLRFLTTFVSSCMQVVLRFLIPAQSSIDFFVTEMGLFVMRTDSMRQQMERATQKIGPLISSIAPTPLLVGGFGAMHVILVKIVERTHAMGVRMVFGTRAMGMLLQFPTEALAVCLLGGALCVGLAPPSLVFDQGACGFQMEFPLNSIIAAFGISVLAGRFAGIVPVRTPAGPGPTESGARG